MFAPDGSTPTRPSRLRFRAPFAHPTPLNASPANVVNLHRLKLERQAIALSRHCPHDGSNPAHCPLFGLRPLSLGERWAWIRSLTHDELAYLGDYHTGCSAEKLSDPHAG